MKDGMSGKPKPRNKLRQFLACIAAMAAVGLGEAVLGNGPHAAISAALLFGAGLFSGIAACYW